MKSVLIVIPGLSARASFYARDVHLMTSVLPRRYNVYKVFPLAREREFGVRYPQFLVWIAEKIAAIGLLFSEMPILNDAPYADYASLFKEKLNYTMSKILFYMPELPSFYNKPYTILDFLYVSYLIGSDQYNVTPRAYEQYFIDEVLTMRDVKVSFVGYSMGGAIVSEFLSYCIKYKDELSERGIELEDVFIFASYIFLPEAHLNSALELVPIDLILGAQDRIISCDKCISIYGKYAPRLRITVSPGGHFSYSLIHKFKAFLRKQLRRERT